MTTQRWWVQEVHNFGGFFGGDTVTLTAVTWPAAGEETTLTIDEKALVNVRDRHTIGAELLLALEFAGDRIERAELLAAREWPALHAATAGPPAGPLAAPQVRAYHCPQCDLWVAGAPAADQCGLCGATVALGV